jgi:PilZ domain
MSEPVPALPNRRRSRRQPAKITTKIFCTKNTMGLGHNVAQSILDLSETGIRLQVKEPLRKDLEVEINLDNLNHPRPLKIRGKIVWSVAGADGTCYIGVQFDKPIRYVNVTMLTKC